MMSIGICDEDKEQRNYLLKVQLFLIYKQPPANTHFAGGCYFYSIYITIGCICLPINASSTVSGMRST